MGREQAGLLVDRPEHQVCDARDGERARLTVMCGMSTTATSGPQFAGWRVKPQLPITSVVTPWRTLLSAVGSTRRVRSE
jgi:hypothetical protein